MKLQVSMTYRLLAFGCVAGSSRDLRRHLHEMAFGQAGYFTAAQAVSIGYTYQAQKYHVDRGNWMRVDRGLFRLSGWPSDPDDSYARWTVWSGGRGVVSHTSALAVHDLSQEVVDAAIAEALLDGRTTRRRVLRRSAEAHDRAALRLERALARQADA